MKTLLVLSVIVAIPAALQAAGEEVSNFPGWAQAGAAGLVVIAIVYTKALVPGWTYQELKTANNELKQELKEAKVENKDLTRQVIEGQAQVLPALQTATTAIQQAMPVVSSALTLMDRQRREG